MDTFSAGLPASSVERGEVDFSRERIDASVVRVWFVFFTHGSSLDRDFFDSISHISCFGFNDGWIKVSPSGGLGPYNLNWDTLGSLDSIGGLPPGVYQLEITDSLGCSDSFVYSITEPSLLTDSVDSTNILCIGDIVYIVDVVYIVYTVYIVNIVFIHCMYKVCV